MFSRGQDLPLWAGYSQAKQQNFIVKKGAKCARILRPNLIKIDLTNKKPENLIKVLKNNKILVTFHLKYLPVTKKY